MKTIFFYLFLYISLTEIAISADPTTSSSYSKKNLEDAWDCEPEILFGINVPEVDRKIRFANPDCSTLSGGIRDEKYYLAKALVAHYGGLSTDEQLQAFDAERERQLKIHFLKAKQEKEIKKAEIEKRKNQLKTGHIKISNFNDVLLFYDSAQDLSEIMQKPLLKPNSKVYLGVVQLDNEEQKDLLRARADFPYRDYLKGINGINIRYAYLTTNDKTVNFAKSALRIGGKVAVLGRYINNAKYTTVIDEERTAPVLEVLYLGDPGTLLGY